MPSLERGSNRAKEPMMLGEHTTEDGYTIRAFGSMYMDYGVSVTNQHGKEVFYRPCVLSCESYGTKPAHPEWSWYDAEQKQLAGIEAFTAWTADDWAECLANEAGDLLEIAGVS